MGELTSGTVTLVFTDIAGSTLLLERLGERYAQLLRDHHDLVTRAADLHQGRRVDAAGDGLFFSFPTAKGALLGCLDAQRAIAGHSWPDGLPVQVRMGIHTGEPLRGESGYVGMDVHRAARICAAGHGGQVLVSETARTLIGSSLPEGVTLRDLGEHRLRDLSTPEHLFQAVAPGLRTDFPPIRSLETLPNNLPRQLSTFVGRDAEIAAATERLAEASLLTMTGAGGVGKTRLALETGARLIGDFTDGVWFVELAALTEADLVANAVVAAMRLKEQPDVDPITTLADALAERRVLLILDNCEHLLETVAELAGTLLQNCPELKLIATSREPLGVEGERLLPVPSLSVPPVGLSDEQLLERLAACDAARLFLERGRAVQPGFTLSRANAAAVAQICLRLDGIPLAVELAAARLRALPPQQIAARLDDRFRLLTGGTRTALPRHRTLRAAMDWSFDLLSEPERALLRRLSVFAGSFSLEAAEEICSGGPVVREEVLDLLARLVDKSLAMPDEGSADARYRLLETIRDYAQERLAETEESREIYRRHRDWFAEVAERAMPAFFAGPEQVHWVARLEEDHDNLRAALQWSDEDPDGASQELSLVAGLWRFWEIRGYLAEGSAWLQRALARTGGEVSPRRAAALTGAGVLAGLRGDYEGAASFHEASLVLQRELGSPTAVAAAASNLASVAAERGDLARAAELYREAIGLARQAGEEQGAAFTVINLADIVARQGDTERAASLYSEAIETFTAIGNRWAVAHATMYLAQLARRSGDFDAARARYQSARTIYAEIGDGRGEARAIAGLGDVAAQSGDEVTAMQRYRQSLDLRQALGDRPGVASALERMAGIASDELLAARLIGHASTMRETIGVPLSPAASAEVNRFLARLGDARGVEQVRQAFEHGRRAPLAALLEDGATRATPEPAGIDAAGQATAGAGAIPEAEAS